MSAYKKYYDKNSEELIPRSTLYKRIARSKNVNRQKIDNQEDHPQNELSQIVSNSYIVILNLKLFL